MTRATDVAETWNGRASLQNSARFATPAGTAEQACSANEARLVSRWAMHQLAGRPAPRLVWRLEGFARVAAGA